MTESKLFWSSPDNDEWCVITDHFDDIVGNTYLTVKSGFQTLEEADDYAKECNSLHDDLTKSIYEAIKKEFPYGSKQTNLTMETTFEELHADPLNRLEVYISVQTDIGCDVEENYQNWKTLQDVYNDYKPLYKEL